MDIKISKKIIKHMKLYEKIKMVILIINMLS